MSAVAKKQTMTVKLDIDPFAEARGKKAPPWVTKLAKDFKKEKVSINRKIDVDPRKWKLKDLQDGAYAVARYELKIFATKLGQIEKKVNSMLPPVKGERNWDEVLKSKATQDKKAVTEAQDSLKSSWDDIAKEIENKVSVALDEVEADTGDNKKALASAKEAFKKFDRVDPIKMLAQPTSELVAVLKKYRTALASEGDKAKEMKKEVEKEVASIEGTFNANSKKMLEVVKYFHDAGKSMAKDDKANMVFQNLGNEIIKESPALKGLEKAIEKLEDQLTAVKNLVKKEDANAGAISSQISALETAKTGAAKLSIDASKSVTNIRALFKEAKTEVKA